MKAVMKGSRRVIFYPTRAITVSQTYRDIYWPHDDDLAAEAEYWYRTEPDDDDDAEIHISSWGCLLAGLENLEGALRAGRDWVRVTMHDHTTAEPLGRDVRMIDLARVSDCTTPMTAVRCMVLYDRLLRDPHCPRIPDVPQTDAADMIAWQLNCSLADARRYLQVLRAPRAVQDALDRDQIDLRTAAQVHKLPQAVQDQIAAWILSLDKTIRSELVKKMTTLYVQAKLEQSGLGRPPLSVKEDKWLEYFIKGRSQKPISQTSTSSTT